MTLIFDTNLSFISSGFIERS